MTVLNIENSILFIVDIQGKLLNASFNKNIIQHKAEILAKTAKILGIPCIIAEQYSKGLGYTIPEVKNNVPDDTKYFEKFDFNALSDDCLLNELKNTGRNQIILVGIEAHICVRQTANALLKEGFDVSVVKDCCSSRFESEYITGLDIMKQEGCFIKSTETVLFELLKSAKHPKFKEVQSLIK